MSGEKELHWIRPLSKKPVLKPRSKVQTNTAKAVQEFIDSGLEYAEVTIKAPKSGTKGLMIGLGKVIGKARKDKYEVRQTADGKVVLIKKK